MTSSDQETCAQSSAQTTAPTKLSIARLNDNLRRDWVGGRVAWTAGIEQLGIDTIINIFEAVNEFDTFTADNDPYGEHDFGAVEIAGQQIFWKIDYYDNDLEHGFPRPVRPCRNDARAHRHAGK